jgi:hypothetical protein
MQQTSLGLSMWKHCYAPLNRLDGICIHGAFFRTWKKEGSLASIEFVVQVNEKGKKRGLFSVCRRSIVDILIFGVNPRRRPCAIYPGMLGGASKEEKRTYQYGHDTPHQGHIYTP